MKKTAIILMLITIFSKCLGFVRDMALSYFYGATASSDIYLVAISIPASIWGIIGMAIGAGFIPLYTEIESKKNREYGVRFAENLLNIVALLSILVMVVGMIFTPWLVKIFASGFEGEIYAQCLMYTRLAFLGSSIIGILPIMSSFLQVNDNFTAPALIGLPLNVVTITFIVVSSKIGEVYLMVGYLLALLAQFMFLMFFIRKKHHHKIRCNLRDENLKKLAKIVVPLAISTSVWSVNQIVDKTLASGITEGGISILNYAGKMNTLIISIFVTSIVTVIYPKISRLLSEENINEFKKIFTSSIIGINIVIIPAAVGMILLARPIVSILFGRGAFSQADVLATAGVLGFYALGLFGVGLREILNKTFYSAKDTLTPMKNGGVTVLINIILSIILSSFLGLNGLALATAIATLSGAMILLYSFRKRFGAFGGRYLITTLAKIVVSAMMMGMCVYISFDKMSFIWGDLIGIAGSVVIGVLVYVLLILAFKIDEVRVVVREVRSKIKR